MIKSQYLTLKTKISTPFFIQNFRSILTINPEMGEVSYSSLSMENSKILEYKLSTMKKFELKARKYKEHVLKWNLSHYNKKRWKTYLNPS